MVVFWRRFRASVRTGFWAIPTLCVFFAAFLALGLVQLDRARTDGFGEAVVFGGGADGAREVLSAITTAMITFTGLVFSITVVVLQLTSSQFSPRILRTFLRDRVTQFSLGVFVATFVYAVLVLRTVSGVEDALFVPAVSTTVGIVLLLVSVGMFVLYIHHVATSIQVSSFLSRIVADTCAVLEHRLPRSALPGVRPRVGPVLLVVPAPRSGVLVSVDADRLLALASEADVVVSSSVPLGSFVPLGAPLLEVSGLGLAEGAGSLLEAFTLSKERTLDQDVAFGFRQLVDVAERALSSGVNDPTTAVQALDGLHDLLRRLAVRHLPPRVGRDGEGVVRVVLHEPSFQEYLALALDEVVQYGRDSLQVRARVRVLLRDVRSCALPEHVAVLDAWVAAHPGLDLDLA